MEVAGYISIAPNKNEIQVEFSLDPIEGMSNMILCSLDECGYLEAKAAPGTLTTIKRLKRSVVLHHYA
jgi:hypothetical protein